MTNALQTKTETPIQHFGKAIENDFHKIAELLPSHCDAARYKRMLINAVASNEYLLELDRKSLFLAVMNVAQTGLELDPNLGHAYLVPRKGKVHAQVGYKGFIQLAYRSEKVISVNAGLVREGDEFTFELGTDGFVKHTMEFKTDKATHVYAIVTVRGAGNNHHQEIDVMSIAEVNGIRDRCSESAKGKNPSFSPWNTSYDAMAKKTVLRRLLKLLPVSTELQRAIGIDEAAEVTEGGDAKSAPQALKATLGIEVKPEEDLDFPEDKIPKD